LKTLLLIISCLCFSYAFSQPVASFTSDKTSGCAPLIVKFTSTSTGNPTQEVWDLQTGGLPSGHVVTGVYNNPGTYTVTLVVKNASGTNAVTKTDYITVFPSPVASFSVDRTVGCNPVTVNFTDHSTSAAGAITSWVWDFGTQPPSGSSGAPSAQHTYTAPGYYSPSLTVTSSNGCSTRVTNSRLIRVVQGIDVDFKDKPTTTCKPPYNIPITNETSGPGTLNYTWHFNGNTSNLEDITASYNAPGTYPVTLVATSNLGCIDSATKNITVTPYNSSFALNSADTACPNQDLTFTNTSSPRPTKFTWDFGDGTSIGAQQPVKSYPTAGTYVVQLLNDFTNCKDTVQKTITISDHIPTDIIATNNKGCKAPLEVSFQSTTPSNQVLSYSWDFGDNSPGSAEANPKHIYTTLGSYTVTLNIVTVGGCTAQSVKTKFVEIFPGNLFLTGVPASGCSPFSFSPVAVSTTPDPIVSYAWDFGDGGTSTSPTPTHLYTGVGKFPVKLTVNTAGGCSLSTSVTNAVEVGTPPATVDFTSSTPTPCATGGVQFSATSSPPATDYLWDFGDGTALVGGDKPLHNFSDTGFFTVTLYAVNNGCSKPMVKPNYVHVLAPLARFTSAVTNCMNPLGITFTNTSKVNPALGPVTYTWNFGDPGIPNSNAANPPPVLYPDTGRYVVSLQVTNGACTHTYTDTVRVTLPQANFSISKSALCRFEKVIFKATGDTSKISTYSWSFNGGPAVNRPYQIDTSFAPTGNYSVTLNVVDKNGCPGTTTIPNAVTVTGPTAKFGTNAPGGCNNTTITFLDSSTSAVPIKEWNFNFGDGPSPPFTVGPFTHKYTKPGIYGVKLTVTDNAGCTDTATLRTPIGITVPKAGFKGDFNTFCPGVDYQFTDTSRGANLQYTWDFGDGVKSNLSNPKHTFAGPDKQYTVKLHIIDNVGCADSTTVQNFVHILKPTAAFTFKDTASICSLLETSFFFGGKDYSDFYWDFGDSTQSISMNPQHFYNTFGQYTATLYTIGNGGCYDSAQRVVNLYNPATTAQATYNPLSACNQITVDFNITTPPNTTFSFYFGDSKWDSTQNKVLQHLYDRPGYYQPVILLKDQYDCLAAVNGVSGNVSVFGSLPLYNIDSTKFCDTGVVNITNFTISNDPIVSHTWDLGDGFTSTDKDIRHVYTQSGLYPVTLTVQTETGCINSLTDTVLVYRTPDPSIQAPDEICVDAKTAINGLLAQPDTAISWLWQFDPTRGSTTQNNIVAYNKVGDYTLSVQAANLLGCKGSATKPLVVHANPTVQTKNITIPIKGSALLPVTYSSGVTTYTWQPPTGLSCADCAIPTASPESTTTYKITVSDSNACAASANLTVSVVCSDKNYFVPNTFSPNGDGMNDVFYPRGNALTRVAHMQIFNRWGQLIFERKDFSANDASQGWDGKVNGQLAPQDVYVFIVDFICENSQIVPYKGNVALIR